MRYFGFFLILPANAPILVLKYLVFLVLALVLSCLILTTLPQSFTEQAVFI